MNSAGVLARDFQCVFAVARRQDTEACCVKHSPKQGEDLWLVIDDQDHSAVRVGRAHLLRVFDGGRSKS